MESTEHRALTRPWHGLELRHLTALAVVAEESSFARAGARLGYTQSAVSQQIAALERIVGEPLVARPGGRHPVSPTPAGEVLLGHAEAIAQRLVAARADIAALTGGRHVTLNVGAYQSVGARLLPNAMREFLAGFPRTTIQLTDSTTDEELLDALEAGRLDFAFAVLPLGDGPFDSIELLRDRYVLLVRADSPLASAGARPSPKEISALDLIGFRQCRSVNEAERQLRAAGVTPRFLFRSNDNGTIHGLVAAGFGAALAPRLVVDENDRRVVALELDHRLSPRIHALVWHRDRELTPEMRAFVEVTSACAGRLDGDTAIQI